MSSIVSKKGFERLGRLQLQACQFGASGTDLEIVTKQHLFSLPQSLQRCGVG